MQNSDAEIRARAAGLAEEVLAGVLAGRRLEWVEEVLGDALVDASRGERERCARVAEARAAMWAATGRRMATGSWPAEGRVQARERRNEALALADALRGADAVSAGE
jgi:hypothetical protein